MLNTYVKQCLGTSSIYTHLATVDELNSALTEEEVDEGVGLEGANKLGLVEPLGVVLVGAQVGGAEVTGDGGVGPGKVHVAASKVLARQSHESGDVGVRAVRTLGDSLDPLRHPTHVLHLQHSRHHLQLKVEQRSSKFKLYVSRTLFLYRRISL